MPTCFPGRFHTGSGSGSSRASGRVRGAGVGRVLVVGAGAAGLTAALRAAEAGARVTLLNSHPPDRALCPSCHAPRLAEWSLWLDERLLAGGAADRAWLRRPNSTWSGAP